MSFLSQLNNVARYQERLSSHLLIGLKLCFSLGQFIAELLTTFSPFQSPSSKLSDFPTIPAKSVEARKMEPATLSITKTFIMQQYLKIAYNYFTFKGGMLKQRWSFFRVMCLWIWDLLHM